MQINLALLRPFSAEEMPVSGEDQDFIENYRHMMRINYLVFHEMRHLYQMQVVTAYTINQNMGGKLTPQPESDKKCALWLEGLKDGKGEVEEDANDFAYYLTNRYPLERPMAEKSRRRAVLTFVAIYAPYHMTQNMKVSSEERWRHRRARSSGAGILTSAPS